MIIRRDNEDTRKLAAQIVANGGLIAFRTDTFYGLGADPLNAVAVAKIKQAKGREEGKPILLLISSERDLEPLIELKPMMLEKVVEKFWPGPLTIVMPAALNLPAEITCNTGTVGLRLPADEKARSLVEACGGRLTATSANPSGQEPATSARQVRDYFPLGIDLIVDGGDVTATKPSTVIDISQDRAKLIREGAVSKEELELVLGKL